MEFMKITKKIILILITIASAFIVFGFSKIYAASASLTNSQTITVGQTINVTASVNAGAWSLELSGNGQTEQFVGSSFSSGVADNVNDSKSISFTPTSTGTYTFTLTGSVDDFNTEEKTNVNKTCTITVKEPEKQPEQSASTVKQSQSAPAATTSNTQEKSSNNYLQSLTISAGALAPEFYRGTMDYTVEFAEDFDIKALSTITIAALAEDSKATVTGTGERTLEDGENILQVVCTAENGAARTYNIKVVKPTPLVQSDLRLSMLEVNEIDEEGYFTKATLNIPFDAETFEYELNVDKDVTALDVDARVEKEGILIRIEGAEELSSGENEVRIILTSQDDDEIQTTYIIKVNKEAAEETQAEDDNNGILGFIKKIGYKNLIFIIAGIIGLLIIVLIILIVVNHKKKKAKKSSIEWNGGEDKEEVNFIENQEGDDIEEIPEKTEENKPEEIKEEVDYSSLSTEDYDYARFKELYEKREEDNKPEEVKPLEETNKETEENNSTNGFDSDILGDEKEPEIKPVLGENEQIFNTSFGEEETKVDINPEYVSYKSEPVDLKELRKAERKKKKHKGKHFG